MFKCPGAVYVLSERGCSQRERKYRHSFSQNKRKMPAFKSLVVWILIMWTFTTADDEVSCVLEESCILPCSFQPGPDPVIHWTQVKPGNTHVHSYYSARDQFVHQGEHFRGRTSLSTDQISRGNASIRLTGLQLQDQGRYECYTSTITGGKHASFINLRAAAKETVESE
ncbi:V-set domain-containing T-cell activation inhibitor 1 [Pleuronectes platessa]|uniref:V-set domain-containing T-cell activation inhibitor 1 n=1 Tax=Pleuronectes platessa TaxID=8262 RepID=UPI00232A47CD|nr:V-set domain-containing T-cell activation inhibitor 1 [Pleuronectes platessa]